jgi:hypothetical protein
MGYLEEKRQRNEALLRALGLVQSEEPTEPEGKVDFDGGVRQPAPDPGNPTREHDQLIAELLRAKQAEGGSPW